jgi:hypothetical protein
MILDSFLALCAWFMADLGFFERLNKIINATNQHTGTMRNILIGFTFILLLAGMHPKRL